MENWAILMEIYHLEQTMELRPSHLYLLPTMGSQVTNLDLAQLRSPNMKNHPVMMDTNSIATMLMTSMHTLELI